MDNLQKMDKFLEKYNLTILNHKETENINRSITSNEIETLIKNLPTNKIPEPDGITNKFYQTFREELALILLKLFQKKKKLQREKHSQTHSTTPPGYQNQIKISLKKKIIGQYH